MRRIVSREEYCIGCTLCQVSCVVAHSSMGNIIKAYTREEPLPRIKLSQTRELAIPVQCHNCAEPPCVDACPTGSMYKDETTRNVNHDRTKCTGCLTCIMVCPFDAVIFDRNISDIPRKCDLCAGLDIPACVANCPNEALILEESPS